MRHFVSPLPGGRGRQDKGGRSGAGPGSFSGENGGQRCKAVGALGRSGWGMKRVVLFCFFFFKILVFFFLFVPYELRYLPLPGIEPMFSAVEAWNPNHWTARKVPEKRFLRFLAVGSGFGACKCKAPKYIYAPILETYEYGTLHGKGKLSVVIS